jgi:hypothetical protein
LSDAPEPASHEAFDALARLRDMPEEPRDLPLAADALSSFDDFRHAHQTETDSLDGWAADWWDKGTGIVLRLAGVLTFLDWAARPKDTAEPARVPAWAIQAAVGLWRDYLWPHARAVFRVAGGSEQERHSRKMLQWLGRQRKLEVSREDLRCRALGRTCDAAETQHIAESLVTAGWLRPVETVHHGPGRPPIRWAVNPSLRAVNDA